MVSDFTPYALESYKIEIFIAAKEECSRKMHFHQNEINNGHYSKYHLEQMEVYHKEFLKWIPIIEKAKERDRKREKDFEILFKQYENNQR